MPVARVVAEGNDAEHRWLRQVGTILRAVLSARRRQERNASPRRHAVDSPAGEAPPCTHDEVSVGGRGSLDAPATDDAGTRSHENRTHPLVTPPYLQHLHSA